MKVYNQNKTEILTEYDLEKGYLKADVLEKEIPEQQAVEEVFHREVIKEYPNGGKEVRKVIDVEGKPYIPAHIQIEEIQVYVPYTEEELEKIKLEKYPVLVDSFIRKRYSLSEELAILRQRDSKVEEFAEYYAYAEECKAMAKASLEEN